jgi:hypothetical protein
MILPLPVFPPEEPMSAFVGVVAFRSFPEAQLQVLSPATPARLQRRKPTCSKFLRSALACVPPEPPKRGVICPCWCCRNAEVPS